MNMTYYQPHHVFQCIFVGGVIACGAWVPANSTDEPVTIGTAISTGKTALDTRYRYEIIEEDGLPEKAAASTLRLALGYETKPLSGVSVLAQFEGAFAAGDDDYRIATVADQNRIGYPVILDPLGTDLNQGYVKYVTGDGKNTVKLGRQEIMLNNGRFVSVSTWRQLHQSFDAASFVNTSVNGLTAMYAYVTRAHRVVGPDATDGRLAMDSQLVNLAYKTTWGVATGYAVLLDYETIPTNSSKSIGLRLTGTYKLNKTLNLLYTAEYAKQSEYADNPNAVDAAYLLTELGVARSGMSVTAGYNVLEGESATNKFNTPLAHPFNGWTEKFAATPNAGLEVLSLTVAGPIDAVAGLSFALVYYDYAAESTDSNYGSEVDVGLEYRPESAEKKWVIGTRYADYKADELFTDTLRYSLYTQYMF